ncbi:MAG TPA: quinone-dependent dihydroorotate dehydrogenase [bacterium]|jgi:dihydroorotate dehydrogenase|nr:quinone-dependent dihydroorotate dehydrogenase [bacterium]
MYKLLRPLLFTLPPEAAHEAAMAGLRLARPVLPLFAGALRCEDPRLAREVCGLRFPNVVGLAAGFDKSARAVDAWQHLGFGHVELGTVTRHAQPGNPRPRAFRYPAEEALINRFGFNNPGADAVALRLEAYRAQGRWPSHPVGINLGKSKITPLEEAAEDYHYSLQRLAPHADYLAVNVSSPNTPGLRALQGPRSIRALVTVLARALKARPGRRPPLFVKLAPDLAPRELLASGDAALAGGADGLILTNTTLSRAGLGAGQHPEGGLSGRPLRVQADACLGAVARHTRGRVPLIGVGGVFTAEDLRRKLDLGAVLVQVYTGFIYEGPGMAAGMQRELLVRLG